MAKASKKTKARRENPEAVPELDEVDRAKKAEASKKAAETRDAFDESDAGDDDKATVKIGRKRGRPAKIRVGLPQKSRKTVALAPLILVQNVAKLGAGVQLQFEAEAVQGVVEAFDAFADSFEFALTPGWAWMVSSLVAASTASVVAEQAANANLTDSERAELEKLRKEVELLKAYVMQQQQATAPPPPPTVEGKVLRIVEGEGNARGPAGPTDSAQPGGAAGPA